MNTSFLGDYWKYRPPPTTPRTDIPDINYTNEIADSTVLQTSDYEEASGILYNLDSTMQHQLFYWIDGISTLRSKDPPGETIPFELIQDRDIYKDINFPTAGRCLTDFLPKVGTTESNKEYE